MSLLQAVGGILADAAALVGTVTVTCANDNRIDGALNSYRCRGFDVGASTDDRTGAPMGSRTPSSLNGLTVNSGFTSRDIRPHGTGAIEFYLAVSGNYVGVPVFTQVLKKNGGSTEDTLLRSGAGTPAGTLDGGQTYWVWTVSVEWPTSGSRDLVFS